MATTVLLQVLCMAAGQSGPMIASYGYIGRRVSQRVYGNDTLMYYAYDGQFNQPDDFGVRQVVGTAHGRIDPATAVVLEILDNRTYVWDRMYNKTQRKDVRSASTGQRLTHDYLYDPAYRMTHATATDTAAPGGPVTVRETTYTLDGVHNRLSTAGQGLRRANTRWTLRPPWKSDEPVHDDAAGPTNVRR